jgi:hypothetical protein
MTEIYWLDRELVPTYRPFIYSKYCSVHLTMVTQKTEGRYIQGVTKTVFTVFQRKLLRYDLEDCAILDTMLCLLFKTINVLENTTASKSILWQNPCCYRKYFIAEAKSAVIYQSVIFLPLHPESRTHWICFGCKVSNNVHLLDAYFFWVGESCLTGIW